MKILIIFSVIGACTLFLSGCNNLSNEAKITGDDFAGDLYPKRESCPTAYELYPWYQRLAITCGAKTPQEVDAFVITAIQETKFRWLQLDANKPPTPPSH